MKITGIIVMGLLSAVELLTGATASGTGNPAVGVCVDGEFSPYDQNIADHAQTLASRTFHRIGVQLDWHRASSSFCGQRWVIQVTYSLHTPIDLVPSALAYTRPYEGIHIDILYDRVSGGNEVERAEVLGYVLVHEITHILQGVARHSDSGIMKDHWNKADFVRMRLVPMLFSEDDVDLIHKGLHERADLAASTRSLAAEGAGRTAAGSSNIEGPFQRK